MTNENTQRTRNAPRLCKAEDCGRPAYARGLCQSHHRQLLKTGRIAAIRAYRRRKSGTIKFAGLRLSPQCAEKIQRKAREEGISPSAAIADILEAWYKKSL